VESFDDDIGPTDDLIGSVKFPLEDIGLETDGTPLECWMVLGKAHQCLLHHSRKLHSCIVVPSFLHLVDHMSLQAGKTHDVVAILLHATDPVLRIMRLVYMTSLRSHFARD
jgi:hypothetical protein